MFTKSSTMSMKHNQTQQKNSRAELVGGDNETAMGLMLSHKSGFNLLQNCDLPPPLKVFAIGNKAVGPPKISMSPCDDDNDEDAVDRGGDINVGRSGGELEKLELLKALRRSQTRAREAEAMGAEVAKERDLLYKAMMGESLQLLAHRQWLRLLELQVSKMRFQTEEQEKKTYDGDGEDAGGTTWIVALAFCLSIVSVGFAFSYINWF